MLKSTAFCTHLICFIAASMTWGNFAQAQTEIQTQMQMQTQMQTQTQTHRQAHELAHDEAWKIIGEDNLVVVTKQAKNLPKAYRKMINAFGRMNVGCTATHIGQGIVLTAGHCFFALANLVQDSDCEDVEIEWGVRQGAHRTQKSKCEKILYMKNDLVRDDFAILKVSPAPKAALEIDLQNTPEVSTKVSLFSHPDDLPLRWSNFCQIHPMAYPELPREALKHDCDTKVGSSGATLIDAKSLKVVGVHGGGRLVDETNGMNYATALTSPELYHALKALGF